MCGRYFIKENVYVGEILLEAKDYYPSDKVPIIINTNHQLEIKRANWGFKTYHNKLVINARSETLLEKSMFKQSVLNHRCVIVASGFYEWDHHKQKFTCESTELLFMAGIYRMVEDHLEMVIITTKANESMQELHHRMPLILDDKSMDDWLNGNIIEDILKGDSRSVMITSGFLQNRLF